MKKLSIKLGLVFFLIIFGLETFMFYFLHTALVDSRVEEELISLQARGNSHRTILERQFDADTTSHVILMESEANTDVVITDINGQILDSSVHSEWIQDYIKNPDSDIPSEGQIVEDNWMDEAFISTVSPINRNAQTAGYVYMFQNTESIHSLIGRLNEHFKLAGIIAVILTIIIIIFLSKALANPLIKMKEATSKISRGDFSVSLPKSGKDELGALSESIQVLAKDLNYLRQERNEFLSSISHELRTPLTYIKGYADIVHKRTLTEEERNKYLGIILDETNRLSGLIKDLFDLAKIDRNSFVIQKRWLDLTQFIRNVEQRFTPAFQQKGIGFEVDCPNGLFLTADPSRLEQIIYNLLDNAIKYSASGSQTILTVRNHKNAMNIRIADTGIGIPEKDIPHIFERFYRVDKSRARSLGGLGMGLAIVKELVHAHGGTMKVNSEVNKGTEFELIFMGGKKNEKYFTS